VPTATSMGATITPSAAPPQPSPRAGSATTLAPSTTPAATPAQPTPQPTSTAASSGP
jgi:hypothetical protein